jgi:hypothetical protein
MQGGPIDLSQLAEQEAAIRNDPWKNSVTINGPDGPRVVPLPIGVFIMLSEIAAQIAKLLEVLQDAPPNQAYILDDEG